MSILELLLVWKKMSISELMLRLSANDFSLACASLITNVFLWSTLTPDAILYFLAYASLPVKIFMFELPLVSKN